MPQVFFCAILCLVIKFKCKGIWEQVQNCWEPAEFVNRVGSRYCADACVHTVPTERIHASTVPTEQTCSHLRWPQSTISLLGTTFSLLLTIFSLLGTTFSLLRTTLHQLFSSPHQLFSSPSQLFSSPHPSTRNTFSMGNKTLTSPAMVEQATKARRYSTMATCLDTTRDVPGILSQGCREEN